MQSMENEKLAGVPLTAEARTLQRYDQFLKLLKDSTEIRDSIGFQCMGFIESIQKLPFIKDDVRSDVRYETFIQRLVGYLQSTLIVTAQEKRLEHCNIVSTIWILKAFRTMIEDSWGMNIYERDDDGGEEQDIASEEIVRAFNTYGVTALCLDIFGMRDILIFLDLRIPS